MSLLRWLAVVMGATVLAFGIRAVIPDQESPTATLTKPVDADETSRLIAVFEARLEERTDYPDLAALGGLYLTRARTTGSPDDYQTAERTLEQAVALAPDQPDTLVALAQTHVAVHDFVAAAEGATRAFELDSTAYDALAVNVDAALALGDLPAARDALDLLTPAAPDDPAVSIRASELAWLTGHTDRALVLADQAHRDADRLGLDPASTATYGAYHAKTLTNLGRYGDALDALRSTPKEAPALFQEGRALAALGDLEAAISAIEHATELRPDPLFLAELAKLYVTTGAEARLVEVDATIEAIAALDGADVYTRSVARWLADRDIDAERALELAYAESRDDPDGHDLRAWALYRNHRFDEARQEADLALAFGTRDAIIAYHSGLIWAALGEETNAAADLERALQWSPRFDPVHADRAVALLEELRS